MLQVKTLVVGPIETNCYIVSDATKEAVVIDPGDEADAILHTIAEDGLQVKYVLCTHGHYDHIQAVDEVCENTGALFAIHGSDVELIKNPWKLGMDEDIHACKDADVILHQGDLISFGSSTLKVIYTPGHTQGGCCFYSEKDKVCFSGDTVFYRTVGRTDLFGGNYRDILKSVQARLSEVSDDTIIYPGHDRSTIMGDERKFNRYFKA